MQFNKIYTSQGLLRNDDGRKLIMQMVATEKNTYILFGDGRVFASGANDKWQCTEIEAMGESSKSTVDMKYLHIYNEESAWLQQQRA